MIQSLNNKNCISELLTAFFNRLNEERVTYCVLRNYEELPDKVGNDLDIWVKDGDQKKFQDILFDSIKCSGWELIEYSPRLSYKGEGDYFISKSDNRIDVIHIDCWSFLYWRGVNYADEKILPDHLYFHKKGFFIPSRGIEGSIKLLKNLIYHGRIEEKYKKQIVESSNQDIATFLKTMERPFGNKYANLILNDARTEKWDEIEDKAGKLRWILIKRALLSKPLHQIRQWGIYSMGHIKKYISPQSGFFIALIGPDGSGKTTIANCLQRNMGNFFSDVKYYHAKFGILPELKVFFNFFARILGNSGRNAVPLNEGAPIGQIRPIGKLRGMVYLLYYTLDYLIGHIVLHRDKSLRKLVLFDRYFYDYFIQQSFQNMPVFMLKVLVFLIPTPDLTIWLENEPQVINKRKSEMNTAQIKWQLQRCRHLIEFIPSGIKIKTDDNPEVTSRIIYDVILQTLISQNHLK